jgi:hypothetical protein|eukprot:COSAG01_NODE_2661_length_7295_cov_10.017371_8_plen_115_part_00
MHLNLWNAMFMHVCVERGQHPEVLQGNELRRFFVEDFYQTGGGESPVSLASLEDRLVEMTKDPRVLFGLCKLGVSSPALVVFTRDIEEQLDEVIRHHCSREVFMDLDRCACRQR